MRDEPNKPFSKLIFREYSFTKHKNRRGPHDLESKMFKDKKIYRYLICTILIYQLNGCLTIFRLIQREITVS